MVNTYKIALWNANGLCQHDEEIKVFIKEHKIDLLLISETHFTNRSFIRIPGYQIYDTPHPDGTAHGGTAVIIRNTIKHHELNKYNKSYLQATSIVIEDWNGPLTLSAVYCPPKHTISNDQFSDFFNTLGTRFIAGGDYNAKHLYWGSRLINPRGRALYKTMADNNFNQITNGHPTYWPTDRNKIPDLLDFCVTKGVAQIYNKSESCFDLSSDHTPVLITISTVLLKNQRPQSLYNQHTDWEYFREQLTSILTTQIPLKTERDIYLAVEYLNRNVQNASFNATNNLQRKGKESLVPPNIQHLIEEKRKLRKNWQATRHQRDKNILNNATNKLKRLLHKLKNEAIQTYLENLSATKETNYSLWKATKKIKQPQANIPPIRKENRSWARTDDEKAQVFAEHLSKVFTPHPSEDTTDSLNQLRQFLEAPHQMSPPISAFSPKEVLHIIHKKLAIRKAPGFDLITCEVLRELPIRAIALITVIFNAILRLGYYPPQWKLAQIILIPKPGKPPCEAESYRPISLLPVISKVFEKLLLKRLRPIILKNNLIPPHQFGFQEKHATIEQIHRVTATIEQDLQAGRYCSAAFLDISQAFDKVWHEGICYKIKQLLPHPYAVLLKSYLTDRSFQVKLPNAKSELTPINAGVPQGSVLGPVLYLLYTADLPTHEKTVTATFADDTAILASNNNPIEASQTLQESLNEVQSWLKKWRIRANENKSKHITFTNRRETCPQVTLNSKVIPQADSVKYLGMHIDRRLNWRTHIWSKRKQLNHQLSKMYWLMGKKSKLSMENKILIYKTVLKPVWTYGIELWGTASTSNVEILQRFQSKVLRIITEAPWYVRNSVIHRDLKIACVKEVIQINSLKYLKKLEKHPNNLAVNLLDNSVTISRLKRISPLDLPVRFINQT